MKKNQIVNKSPRMQPHRRYVTAPAPMVDPRLLRKVQSQGVILRETSLKVLGLGVCDIKRLEDAGIFSLEQFASSIDTNILNIPRFGIMRVRRIQADLKSYLTSLLNDQSPENDRKSGLEDTITTSLVDSNHQAIYPSARPKLDSELEAFSNSLVRLEKRMRSLELRLAKIKNNYRNNSF